VTVANDEHWNKEIVAMKHVVRFLVATTIAASASLFGTSHASANGYDYLGNRFDRIDNRFDLIDGRFGRMNRFIDADGDLQIVFESGRIAPGWSRLVAHADVTAEFACMDLDGLRYDLDGRFVIRDTVYDYAGIAAGPAGFTVGRFVLEFDPLRMAYACPLDSKPVLLRLTYTDIVVRDLATGCATRLCGASRRYPVCIDSLDVGEYIDEDLDVGQYDLGQLDLGQVDLGKGDLGQIDLGGKGDLGQVDLGKGAIVGQMDNIGKGAVVGQMDNIGKGAVVGQMDSIGKGDLGQMDTIGKGAVVGQMDNIGKGDLGQMDTIGKGAVVGQMDNIGKGDVGQYYMGGKGDVDVYYSGKGDLDLYYGRRQYIGK
jgi:hypothetical protein